MSDVKGIKASVQSIDVIHAEIESNLQRVRYETEEVNVEPSTKEQTILASPEKYIDKVNVKPVTASVDKNIVPENIKVNTNILGIAGTFTEDATATADDIREGKTAYVNGVKIIGTMIDKDQPIVDEYTKLNYIASTGTQYIDTGLTFSNSYFGYDIKFRLTEITQGGSILGINKSVSSLTINSSKFMLNGTNLTNADTGVHILEYDRATGIANLDGQEYSIATSLVDVGDNVNIFRRSGSATSNTKLELYYFKLYDINRVLHRDFIPVKDKEGVVCLFDKVNSEYYYNQGTGTFVAGSEVIDG